MKTTLKLAFMALVVFALASCEKEEKTDYRDSRVGMYSGTVKFSIPEEGYLETKPISAKIAKGYGRTELTIQNLGLPYAAIAVLDNNTYTYYPFRGGGNSSCSVTTLVVYNGSGTFTGDSLHEYGTLELASNGYTFTGTWETHLKKN